jgi:hypothetical protein
VLQGEQLPQVGHVPGALDEDAVGVPDIPPVALALPVLLYTLADPVADPVTEGYRDTLAYEGVFREDADAVGVEVKI